MSILKTETLSVLKVYPALGITVEGSAETVQVQYDVVSLQSLEGTTAVINYKATVDGVVSPTTQQLEFEYSGRGNPITEGEAALKELLSA